MPVKNMKVIVGVALLVLSTHAAAQHSHLNAGAFSTGQDAQLYFVNGANFVTNSGYVLGLTYATNGQYAGYYHGSITLTALPATVSNGGPAFGHAALGSFLEAQVESVKGPAGGSLGFWEDLDTEPRFSIQTGITNSSRRFPLSESDGSTGSDPAGHIHGRRFTATAPGLYTVGFRIKDVSHNGADGGPFHQDSELFPIYFQAGTSVGWLTVETTGVAVTFATRSNQFYFLEAAPQLPPGEWQTVAGPLLGNDHLQTVTDRGADGAERYYRLRVTTP